MSGSLAGLGKLLRFTARRDRVRGSVWVLSLTALVAVSGGSISALYDTPQSRREYAVLALSDETFKAIGGPGFGLDDPTLGAVMMNEVSAYVFVGVALMVIFLLTRHTRAEETTDRAELVRAAPIGRYAPLAAAAIWVVTLSAVLAIAMLLTFVGLGLGVAGSVAFALSVFAVGVFFTGVAAVAVQVGSTGRAANAGAGGALGAMFILRAAGDVGVPILTWISPLGWAWHIRAFAGERWWVPLLLLGGGATLFVVALRLAATRDLGAGLLAQRPGPAVGSPRLASPLALAARLVRPALIGWTIGVAVLAAFMGMIADQADDFLENEAFAEFIAVNDLASPAETFLGVAMFFVGLVGSGFTVSAVLRLRTEEHEGRAEPVLSLGVPRWRWLLSFTTVSAIGSMLIVAVAGAAAGLAYGLQTGDLSEVVRMAGAGLLWAPAQFVLGAFALALVGLRPRWATVAWAGLAAGLVIGMLAETLDLSQPIRDLSPFEHVPSLPAEPFQLLPVAVLLAVTAALVAVGLTGFQRRDIGA